MEVVMTKLQTIGSLLLCLNLSACVASSPDATAGRENYKNYGEKIDDTRILNFIRNKFRTDPLIPSNAIHISIDRGIVQLSGFIMDYQEANMAVLSAQGAPGVRDVINNLIVRSSTDYTKRRTNVEKYSVPR